MHPPAEHLQSTRSYYNEFAVGYEKERGGRIAGGYHDLVDSLEVDFVRRFGVGADILEVGCGTGLLLEKMKLFAKSLRGIDLSPGMLALAKQRGFDVIEASATEIPFQDESFDVVCSFKVLAHVQDIEKALSEMMRVTRKGGTVIAEFYNPVSLRGVVKRFGPARAISDRTKESAVFTRFDSPEIAKSMLSSGTRFVGARGVRIVTPTAFVMRVPFLKDILWKLEWTLADSYFSRFGGFWIGAFRKN